jgi:hypothetical protein
MSVVGILAWKSALHHGRPIEVPDFKKECSRKGHEKDNFSPFPKFRGPGQPAPSILGQLEPKKEYLAYARKVWAGIGYHGK